MIHKTVSGSGDLNTTGDGDYFYYDGHRPLEHHKHNGTSLALYRQYVYGLDYIDEVVAYYDSDETPTDPHFILQDVNYNVVATTDHEGYLEQQYNYKPYGERLAAERIESDGTITDILGTPSLIATTKGHQGLDHMPEIDGINNRTRILKPKLGRYMQEDPNQTSLVLFDVMLTNAQNAYVSAVVSAGGQHIDGPNLYQYLGSNPVNRRDAAGLFEDTPYEGPDAWELAQQVPGEWMAGFAWATQVLNTGLDVTKGFALAALSFTPAGIAVDLWEVYKNLDKSPGDWSPWDIASFGATAITAAIPFAKLAKSAFRYVGKGIKMGKGRQLAKVTRGVAGAICFAAGTTVLMGDGSEKPIEDVSLGDYVRCEPDPTLNGATVPPLVADIVSTPTGDVEYREVAENASAIADEPSVKHRGRNEIGAYNDDLQE